VPAGLDVVKVHGRRTPHSVDPPLTYMHTLLTSSIVNEILKGSTQGILIRFQIYVR